MNAGSIVVFVIYPDGKVHGANMGHTWVLSAPDGPHFGPMNLTTGVYMTTKTLIQLFVASFWIYAKICIKEVLFLLLTDR